MRYVVLEHRRLLEVHWDLMLEWPYRELRTWALPTPLGGGGWSPATELPDHRLAYLSYEGSVSLSRGFVRRWDQGEYRLWHESPNEIRLTARGGRETWMVELHRLDLPEEDSAWRIRTQRTSVPEGPSVRTRMVDTP